MNLNDYITNKFYNKILPIIVGEVNEICLNALKEDEYFKTLENTREVLQYSKNYDKLLEIPESYKYKIDNSYGAEIMKEILVFICRDYKEESNAFDFLVNKMEDINNELLWYVCADDPFTIRESHYYYKYDADCAFIARSLIVERTIFDIMLEYIRHTFIEIVEEYLNN